MDIFPTRKDVDWEEFESGKVVIVMSKDLSSLEEKIANFVGAPKTVKRPLDEMNSKLWLLMDGKMTVKQIVLEMDRIFAEKIAPSNERVNRSIADFVNLGLVKLDRLGVEGESE